MVATISNLDILNVRFWVTRESYTAQAVSVFRDASNKAILIRFGEYIYSCEESSEGMLLRSVIARKPRYTDYRPEAGIYSHRCWTNTDSELLVSLEPSSRSTTWTAPVLDPVQTRLVVGRMRRVSGLATFSLPTHALLPKAEAVVRDLQISWLPGGYEKR